MTLKTMKTHEDITNYILYLDYDIYPFEPGTYTLEETREAVDYQRQFSEHWTRNKGATIVEVRTIIERKIIEYIPPEGY